MMIYGAIKCGITITLDELTMPMLTDLLSYEAKMNGNDKKESKSLSEIAKGGKL